MKIIFSRKGFDSSAGGCPSPIVNGRPISLPIPTRSPSVTTYGDLGGDVASMVRDLTRGRLGSGNHCHLDPDITPQIIPRMDGWRGSLGQLSSSQSHLEKQGVEVGDLFLFWGLFRPVAFDGQWKYIGRAEHRIWGWLQIGEIIRLGSNGAHVLAARPWLWDHPHVRSGWSDNNTLYLSAPDLSFENSARGVPGFGAFTRGHRLTDGDRSPSFWKVPDWLHPASGGCGMSYHPPGRWLADGVVQTAGRGQEFVAKPSRKSADDWLAQLIREAHS